MKSGRPARQHRQPTEYSVREVAEMIVELSGSGSEISHQPLPEDDPKHCPGITRPGSAGLGAADGGPRGPRGTLEWFASQAEARSEASPTTVKAPEVRILLTGGAGFAGSYVAEHLLQSGHKSPSWTISRRALAGTSPKEHSSTRPTSARGAPRSSETSGPRRSATRPPRWT